MGQRVSVSGHCARRHAPLRDERDHRCSNGSVRTPPAHGCRKLHVRPAQRHAVDDRHRCLQAAQRRAASRAFEPPGTVAHSFAWPHRCWRAWSGATSRAISKSSRLTSKRAERDQGNDGDALPLLIPTERLRTAPWPWPFQARSNSKTSALSVASMSTARSSAKAAPSPCASSRSPIETAPRATCSQA